MKSPDWLQDSFEDELLLHDSPAGCAEIYKADNFTQPPSEYLRNDTSNCACVSFATCWVKGSAAAVYVPLLFTAYSKEEKNKLGHYFKQGFPLEPALLSDR